MIILTKELIRGAYNEAKTPEKIQQIDMDKSHLTDIAPDALHAFTNLYMLSLRVNQITLIDRSTFKNSKLLQELWLSQNCLTSIDPNMICSLKKLKKLWCDNNLIKRVVPDNFSSLFNLRILWLSGNKIEKIYSNTFRGLNHLEELFLNDNQIILIESSGFSDLEKLNELALNGNKISRLEQDTFSDLKNLKELYLFNNPIFSIDIMLFADNPVLSIVEIFSENKNEIKDIHRLRETGSPTLFHSSFKESVKDLKISKKYSTNIIHKYKQESEEFTYQKDKDYGKNYSKGQFKTLKLLGSGNFGKVYLVHDFFDNKKKSLKIMFNALLSSDETESVCTETMFLKKFKHPYLVNYLDYFHEKDLFCIVIEYCDMGDLKELINHYRYKKNKINEYTIFRWTRQILSALCFLHENNIIHRDVKPSNIFLNGADITLGDLGLARSVEPKDNNVYSFVGTFNYMSPELINNKGYLFKSDIWAAGCVLFEMIALKKAFSGGLFSICNDISEGKLPEFKTTPILEYLVNMMLQRNPTKRWDAKQLLNFSERTESAIGQEEVQI